MTGQDVVEILKWVMSQPVTGITSAIIFGAIALRIMNERPSSLINALANLLWGWRRRKGNNDAGHQS